MRTQLEAMYSELAAQREAIAREVDATRLAADAEIRRIRGDAEPVYDQLPLTEAGPSLEAWVANQWHRFLAGLGPEMDAAKPEAVAQARRRAAERIAEARSESNGRGLDLPWTTPADTLEHEPIGETNADQLDEKTFWPDRAPFWESSETPKAQRRRVRKLLGVFSQLVLLGAAITLVVTRVS
ncbi:MAG TPA: hypothetical protein VIC35_07000 [Acidimicrobiia bacterium]|jgi:hypothetical protein